MCFFFLNTGTEAMSVATLKSTVQRLLESLSSPLFHVNWPKVHASWNKLLRDSSRADEFRPLLTLLSQCLKAPIYMNLWNDGSGHTRYLSLLQSDTNLFISVSRTLSFLFSFEFLLIFMFKYSGECG